MPTPIANLPVLSATEFLNKKFDPPSPATLKHRQETLMRIAADCARCGDTVDGIFKYVRYQSKQFGLNIADVSLRDLAQQSFDAWWNRPENKVKGGAYDFVLGPRDGETEGAFPLGEVSGIQGSSGTGKSRLAYPMLLDQRDGESVFGRPTYQRDFIVVMLDRSANSLQRTLDGLGIDQDELPHIVLTPEQEKQAPHVVLADIFSQRQGVQVIFIEGLDLWCQDINEMRAVQQLLSPLQKFAERTHTAIIASVGAPKVKAKDGYKAPRDRAIGSSAWARKFDTVLDIVQDHDAGDIRHITLLPRGADAQRWKAQFVDGRLEEITPSIPLHIDKVPAENPREQAQQLHRAGFNKDEIAVRLGVHPRTVRRYLPDVDERRA